LLLESALAFYLRADQGPSSPKNSGISSAYHKFWGIRITQERQYFREVTLEVAYGWIDDKEALEFSCKKSLTGNSSGSSEDQMLIKMQTGKTVFMRLHWNKDSIEN
jgi:hypothetical protein